MHFVNILSAQVLAAFILQLHLSYGAHAIANNESITPHMGWNTWNYHGCDIDENIVMTAAISLLQSGLSKKDTTLCGSVSESQRHNFE